MGGELSPLIISAQGWGPANKLHGLYPFSYAYDNSIDAYETAFGASAGHALLFSNGPDWPGIIVNTNAQIASIAANNKTIFWSICTPVGSTMAALAAGSYDTYLNQLADIYLATRPSDPTICVRIFQEQQFESQPWCSVGVEADWIAAFQHTVQLFLAKSLRFRFVWCPAWTGTTYDPGITWPGDSYVDVIGMDVYYLTTYDGTDPTAAWRVKLEASGFGINWLLAFAHAHNKPIAFPEWGIESDTSGLYISALAELIQYENIAYHTYYNQNMGTGFQCRIDDGAYPNAFARYRSEFINPVKPNLLTAGNDFTNAAWNVHEFQTPVTGQLDTLGTNTATKLLETVANDSHFVQQVITQSANVKRYRMHITVKTEGARYGIACLFGNSGFAGGAVSYVNLNTIAAGGTAYGYGGFNLYSTMVFPSLNGLTKVGIEFDSTADTSLIANFGAASADGTNSYSGSLTKGLTVHNAWLRSVLPAPAIVVKPLISRFGFAGYGIKRAGLFTGKAGTIAVSAKKTRFGFAGYGVKRAGSFAGRAGTRQLPIATGAVTLAGTASVLRVARRVPAVVGPVVLAGVTTGLTYTALPITVGNLSTAVQTVGPFQSSTGNVYVLGRDSVTATTLRTMKAVYPVATFASAATQTGYTTGILDVAAFQVGDIIHMVVTDGTLATSINKKYRTFDMATDAFVTSETIVSSLATAGQSGGGIPLSDIMVRSNGEVVVAYNSAQTGATLYARVGYQRRTGVATWATLVALEGAPAFDSKLLCLASVGDRVHFFLTPTGGAQAGEFRVRTLSAANSLSSLNTIVTYSGAPPARTFARAWTGTDANDWITVVFGFGDGNLYGLSNNSSDTLSGMTPIAVGGTADGWTPTNPPYWMFNDADNAAHFVSVDDASQDLWLSTTQANTHGATFYLGALKKAATVTASATGHSKGGTVYLRGSYVLPIVYTESGALKYNELVVRSSVAAYRLGAATGTVAVAGPATALRTVRVATAVKGTLLVNGVTIGLRFGHVVTAAQGTVNLSGVAAGLRLARNVPAVKGSLILGGAATGLVYSGTPAKVLVTATGAVAIAGVASVLKYTRVVPAVKGTLTVGGAATVLRYGRVATALNGTLTVNGVTTGLRYGHVVVAAKGTLAVNPVAAILSYRRVMSLVSGAFAVSGSVTNLVGSGVPAKTLPVAVGALVVGAPPAVLRRFGVVTAVRGTVTLGGVTTGLREARRLSASVGALSLNGPAVLLRQGRVAKAVVGTLTLTGWPAGLVYSVSGVTAGVNVWMGSGWVEKPAKVWTGAAWMQKPVKVWNGSAWV